jgi:hypothetical protein
MFLRTTVCLVALTTLAGCASSSDHHSHHAPAPSAGAMPQDMQLPPGMTEADMQACMAAATPGEPHARLAKGAGTWHGTQQLWMGPGMEPMSSTCTSTVSSLMDGRYAKCEVAGEMPGMGPFNGLGLTGFDNVSKKFVASWVDNMGTGIMYGTGDLSGDGKTLTINYTYNCPITQKPTTMRSVETMTGADTMRLEMFARDPKSGVEYKMMSTEFTRTKKAVALR